MVEKLLTTAEVARQLGIPEAEVQRLVEAGELKALRLSGEVVRFHPQDVAAWQVAHPSVASSPWWEPWAEFLYTYDFYLVAALLLVVIVGAIFVMRS